MTPSTRVTGLTILVAGALVAASSAAAQARVAAQATGAQCTSAEVRSHPGGGRLKMIAADREAVVWVVGTGRSQSLYACVPGTRRRHVIERAATRDGLTESLTGVRVAGRAIGYVFTSSDSTSTSVSLRVARADGSTEVSESVGQAGEDPRPGDEGPAAASALGSWTLDALGDLLWSETATGVDATQRTELVGLAGSDPGPVDPVVVAVGGPFTGLRLDAGSATWTTAGRSGRVDLRGRTALERPAHRLGTCALLTAAETSAALGAGRLPEPLRTAGSCDYETAQRALNLTQRYGPFALLTSDERAGEESAVSGLSGTTPLGGIGDAAYLHTDALGPVELTVFRGAFEFDIEEFPNATVAGLEAVASEVLQNVG